MLTMSSSIARPMALRSAAISKAKTNSSSATNLRPSRPVVATNALGGSDDERPKLTRENEPEEYWVSEREKAGKSAFSDPVAIIGIHAIFFPIILLLILSGLGVVDLTPQ